MSDKDKGLYLKYDVKRVDGKASGPGIFLEFDDPNSHSAILEYANVVQSKGYVSLANDLREEVGRFIIFDRNVVEDVTNLRFAVYDRHTGLVIDQGSGGSNVGILAKAGLGLVHQYLGTAFRYLDGENTNKPSVHKFPDKLKDMRKLIETKNNR